MMYNIDTPKRSKLLCNSICILTHKTSYSDLVSKLVFKCDPGITLIYCFDFQVDRVIFCLFLGVDVKIYEHLMSVYFPVGESVAEEQSAGAVAAAAGQSISYTGKEI